MARVWLVALSVVLGVLVLGGISPREETPALTMQIQAVAEAPGTHGLFVHGGAETWYQPLAVYPSALLLAARVPLDIALRLPSLIAAITVLWLTYGLARRTPLPATWALCAPTMLLAMPGFLSHAGAAGGVMLLMAAILAWCVAVVDYAARPRQWVLIVGATVLAAAAYAHPAGVLSVPAFFALGAIALRREGVAWGPVLRAFTAMVAVLIPIAGWIVMHPQAYPDTLGRWAIHAAHIRNPIDGVVAVTRWHVVARRVSDYWNYFNPTFLFGSGQLFGLASVVLLPLAVVGMTRLGKLRPVAWRLVIAAMLLVPISAVMLDSGRQAAAVLTMLPLGAVLASAGLAAIAEKRGLRPVERAAFSPFS